MKSLTVFDMSMLTKRLPKQLKELLRANPDRMFVAGGFIRSVIANEPVSDIDVFTRSRDDAIFHAGQLAAKTNGESIKTDNAISVRSKTMPPVQFISRWSFDTPAACVASFDFTIACAAFWATIDGDKTVWASLAAEDFYPDLAAKRLVYLSPIRNEDAGGSMLRVLKFYQRGYRIPLDSLGAVIARMVLGVKEDSKAWQTRNEADFAKLFTSLLVEVDPNAFIDHAAYLTPPETEEPAAT